MDLKIDWSIFDNEPEDTCYCRCKVMYRSHSKVHMHENKLYTVTREPCLGCGESINNCYRIKSYPEIYSIN